MSSQRYSDVCGCLAEADGVSHAILGLLSPPPEIINHKTVSTFFMSNEKPWTVASKKSEGRTAREWEDWLHAQKTKYQHFLYNHWTCVSTHEVTFKWKQQN